MIVTRIITVVQCFGVLEYPNDHVDLIWDGDTKQKVQSILTMADFVYTCEYM